MAVNIGKLIPGLGVNYTSPATQTGVARPGSATARYVPSYAAPTGKTTTQVAAENKVVQRATQPVNVTGVAVPSYATNPAAIARANQINAGVVSGSPVTLQTNADGTLGSTVTEEPVVAGGTTGGTTTGTTTDGTTTDGTTDSGVDVQALYDSLINNLLEGTFIGFQGDQASELRRLQNLRNQLYGDPEYGTTGSLQRQRDLDARARRRLAAQRAVAGMLQGGAYAGPQRGLGTIQQEQQEYDIQEMLRPYREQTQADRLREFGLGYTPDSRAFDLLDFGNAEDIMSGWATGTFAGRQAAAEAKRAALEQLAQRGLSL